jgi:flavodoxin
MEIRIFPIIKNVRDKYPMDPYISCGIMKINIIHATRRGNGKKVAEAIRDVARKRGHGVKIFSARKTKAGDVPPSDLYIFILTIYYGFPSIKMKGFIRRISGDRKGSYVIILVGSDLPNTRPRTALSRILDRKGWNSLNDGVEVKLIETKGPIEKESMVRLKTYAASL